MLHDESLISVIMPAFNAEKYIDLSIQSILDQDYKNFELVVIDDGSTDNTYIKLKSWEEKDHRINILRNEKNMGLGFTTNLALQNTNGTYIAKLDSDDIALKDWLSSRLKILQKEKDLIVVSGSRHMINSDGKVLSKTHESISPKIIRWKLIFGNPVIHPGVVFKKINNISYKNLRYLEDWDFWTQMIKYGNILIVNDHKIKYRIHQSNTSSKLGSNKKELNNVVGNIINKQLSELFNITIPDNYFWYLYRDRLVLKVDDGLLYKIDKTLLDIFQLFLRSHQNLSKKEKLFLQFSLWDELIHLHRNNKLPLKKVISIYKLYPIKIYDIFRYSEGRRNLKKIIYVMIKNTLF